MKKILSLLFLFSLINCGGIFKKDPQLLFIQSGKTASFDGKVLRINQPSPHTLFFSDRPYRSVGHISNETFSKIWYNKKQQNSFKKDSPNSAISYYDKNGRPYVVIIETSNLKVAKNSISYDVKILQGKLKKEMKEVSLFIDETNIIPGGQDVDHPANWSMGN